QQGCRPPSERLDVALVRGEVWVQVLQEPALAAWPRNDWIRHISPFAIVGAETARPPRGWQGLGQCQVVSSPVWRRWSGAYRRRSIALFMSTSARPVRSMRRG